MATNNLKKLEMLGQSFWLDYIRRDLIIGGELRQMINEYGLSGMTSNPTIFKEAITESNVYELDIHSLTYVVRSTREIYEAIVKRDIQKSADEFRKIYDMTGGRDGYVSIEVSPHFAYDTEATITEACRFWTEINRSNVFIKVPATEEGLAAIKELTYEGLNINVTLLFGLTRYRQVAEAYLQGIEGRLAQGKSVSNIRSVASFFVSRIDSMIDPMLEKIIEKGGDNAEIAKKLHGQVAVASAKVAYKIYNEIFQSDRFKKLADSGANSQHLLWASTSTKNPEFSDVKYIDSLIGTDTISTIKKDTIQTYLDHGNPQSTLAHGVEEAQWVLDQLVHIGIDLDQVTQKIEDEGIEKFADSFDELMNALNLNVSQKR